jgi:usherin
MCCFVLFCVVFSDADLSPYSVYQYSVVVVNKAGSTPSQYTQGRTMEAPPTGVTPPTTRINPDQLYIVYLSWSLPKQPNGVMSMFLSE